MTGGAGALELMLTGQDDDFGGTVTLDGTACLAGGVLVGSYDGRDIAFSVTQRGTTIEFDGRVVDDALEGTLRSDCDAMDGTWRALRTDR